MDTPAVSSDSVAERIEAMRISAAASVASIESAAAKSAEPLARVVVAYRALLADTGARIIRAQANVAIARGKNPTDPGLAALERRVVALLTTWAAHAHGYTAYERPATDAEKSNAIQVGIAPMIIISLAIAGAVIAVSLMGIAWAVVHYKEAQTLSDEVALVERDPSIADQLAKLNQTVPGSRLPEPPTPTDSGWGWLLLGLGVAGAAVYVLPKLGKG